MDLNRLVLLSPERRQVFLFKPINPSEVGCNALYQLVSINEVGEGLLQDPTDEWAIVIRSKDDMK